MDRVDELTGDLAEQAARWLDAETLDDLDRALQEDPDAVIPYEPRTKAIVGALHPFAGNPGDDARRVERGELIAMARKTIDELRRRQGISSTARPFDRDGQVGAALLALMVARPAIKVSGGTFVAPRTKPWDVLDASRELIETVFSRVGRIEVPALPFPHYAGTGFVIGDGLVLTNRHVVQAFARRNAEGRWVPHTGYTARIDFDEERQPDGETAPAAAQARTTFTVEEILGCHDDENREQGMDLALLRVARRSLDGSATLPEPVVLSPDGQGAAQGPPAFLVGYPGRQEKNPEPSLMDGLFERIYYVKHLQPGMVMHVITEGRQKGILQHDCSTLPGNSGSCLVDLATGDVIGLHYAGVHGRFNLAVALWMLRDDPFLSHFEINWAA
jgi:hypothetical protein